MEIILFNINDPEHKEALENIVLSAFQKLKGTDLVTFQAVKEEDERWTIEQVCEYFGTEGKPIKKATVFKYQREWGMPYTPGRPSSYWKLQIQEWEKNVLSKKHKNKSH